MAQFNHNDNNSHIKIIHHHHHDEPPPINSSSIITAITNVTIATAAMATTTMTTTTTTTTTTTATNIDEDLCSKHEFHCRIDGYCIPIEQRCDGWIQCTDRTDEDDCSASFTKGLNCNE